MTPVELRLRNFLSYGEAAPPLDLEGIRVAVLSGGNGQGKSALLDAVTWALWGEARKSADKIKPDEELLRAGAREMEVDLTFRLDADTYRVVRRFTQSASGKTSKPGLEFQVRDADGWRTLTAESVRATQAAITARLAMDYETFVNSTFLLQGRSDEFTRKKPGERKEILGKILGLDRYERLAQRASGRWTAARDRAARLDTEAERLVAALGPIDAWTAERAEVQLAVEAHEAAVAAAQAAAAAAGERLAAAESAAREADAAREARRAAGSRADALDAERAALDARIAEADALIARADAVEADAAAHDALGAERRALDERATLFRALADQRSRAQADVDRAQRDAEMALERADLARAALEQRLAADEARLAGRDATARALADADAAAAQLPRLTALRDRRHVAETRLAGVDKEVAHARGELTARVESLRAEHARLSASLAADLPDTDALAARVEAGRAAEAELETVREAGAARGAQVDALSAALARWADQSAALAERRARLDAATDEACPTCGTPLTDDHRAEVGRTYEREARETEQKAAADRAARDAAARERDALRARFKAIQQTAADGRAAAEALADARARAAQDAETRARLAAIAREGKAARVERDAGGVPPALLARRTEIERELDGITFDPEQFAALQAAAAGRDRLRADLRELERIAGEAETARASLARARADVEARREALASGAPSAAERARLAAVEAQIAGVGYDAARHESVQRELDRLAGAPLALKALFDARRTAAEGAERRAVLRDERAAADAEIARLDAVLASLAERLAERDAARAQRDAAREQATTAAAALSSALARRGALDERLARAEQDRDALARVRRELREAKAERQLYGHLRRAFSKNGIPSLIVEETLPEVEDRANRLLERLDGGRTRVALETLKDKKTGGTKETLDIRITDGAGLPRAYEMYSGGEAFRVNFALRLALAQMLAERAGTRIRTLVVDEGFGTQDREGLAALVGAIHAVQDDFDLILVITHLDELKAAFPVRIEVRKEPVTGSTFEIVGV